MQLKQRANAGTLSQGEKVGKGAASRVNKKGLRSALYPLSRTIQVERIEGRGRVNRTGSNPVKINSCVALRTV
jgi:hypothetical protein